MAKNDGTKAKIKQKSNTPRRLERKPAPKKLKAKDKISKKEIHLNNRFDYINDYLSPYKNVMNIKV